MKRTLKITAVLLVIVMLSPLMVAFARPVCPIERQMAQIYAQAVADVTDEQIAEIAALREAEEEFLANLSPETMWEEWLKDNCVAGLSRAEIRYIREKIEGLYEHMTDTSHISYDVMGDRSAGQIVANSTPLSRNIEVWTRRFSRMDGLTNAVVVSAIEAYGVMAGASAAVSFPNDHWKQDAFRHYAWNFFAAGSVAVGITSAGRTSSTRIYTTNREWVSMFFATHQREGYGNISNPTDHQIAKGINWRNRVMNMGFWEWNAVFLFNNNGIGLESLMDLWNNEFGRRDASSTRELSIVLFNIRWNNNELIRRPGDTEVTLVRREQIYHNGWDMPVR